MSVRRGNTYWRFRCDCGKYVTACVSNVTAGRMKSCGCFRRDACRKVGELSIHGDTKGRRISSEYRTWRGMKTRCYNPRYSGYKNYGGRGIRVCRKWLRSYRAFLTYLLQHLGRRPSKLYSLDRINNDRNYEPGNLRWATSREQALNKKRNIRRIKHGND